MSGSEYVHGYDGREARRLNDQATTLAELLHCDTRYGAGERVLEAGCGVGAQTVHLARHSPEARFVCMDISAASLGQARQRVEAEGLTNVTFQRADLFQLRFAPGEYDHVFVCFVLEHLPDPSAAVDALLRVLRSGGTLTVIEGDHGSAFFHPDSQAARRAIDALVAAQAAGGGDALIGRRLYPLLDRPDLADLHVRPVTVYADSSRPGMVEGFTRNTFSAMVEGARPRVLELGLMDADAFDEGVRDLYRTAEPGGTFHYTFFKAVARKR